MKRPKVPLSVVLIGLGLSWGLAGQQTANQPAPPLKVGIIHIQNALLGTKEGQKAAAELQQKFEPIRKKLESMQDEIASLQAELSRGSNTMSDERRRELARQIDEKTRQLNRATEDAQMEFQQEQERVLDALGQKMMAVITKYSQENGYMLILDVSSPQTPVLYASNAIDITQDIIKLYDAQYGSGSGSSSPGSANPAARSDTKGAN